METRRIEEVRAPQTPRNTRNRRRAQVKMMFEVETLKNASPATVSRAGIIYLSEVELDWEALFTAWVKTRPEDQRDILTRLKEKWLGKCLTQRPMRIDFSS